VTVERCVECEGHVTAGAAELDQEVAGHRFHATVPALVCDSCGEVYFDGKSVGEFETEVALRLMEAGETDGGALKFIRRVAGLRGNELAELLAVRSKTVSRWERGTRPIDRASYAVLQRLLLEHARGDTEMSAYLRRLQKPKRLGKNVRLRPLEKRRGQFTPNRRSISISRSMPR
jgi:putative zinc finger/helix-turn-helix YgiT family protein